MSEKTAYDVTVVGGGHNGLVAAAYLARAGLSVLVLERLAHVGGAAVSAVAFPGHPARLSRYSYLVSLMPQQLIDELGLDIRLASRTTASYTPTLRDGTYSGLFVERPEVGGTASSFREITGGDEEYAAWRAFYAEVAGLAEALAPTLLDPLPTERSLRERVDPQVWEDLVSRPIGEAIERRFTDDTVRGVVATDALIGTFASLHDPSLIQNRCFLYHLIGNGTGEWRVPVGGMGAVTGALGRAASTAGAEIITSAGVSAIRAGDEGAEVTFHDGHADRTVSTRHVLAGVAPWVLRILMGEGEDPESKPQGSQLKINLLLDRLPRLKSGVDPGGRLRRHASHLAEDYSQLETGVRRRGRRRVPTVMPGEIYCHSLTDPSILGDAPEGMQTRPLRRSIPRPRCSSRTRRRARRRPCRARCRARRAPRRADRLLHRHRRQRPALHRGEGPAGRRGRPRHARRPHLPRRPRAGPGPRPGRLETPAQRWGVQTDVASVLVCGSGARRGGAVSGLGGHNAAKAVLESR